MLRDYRFRPALKNENHFSVRFGSGKPICNPTKELDSMQREYGLPFICISNARHVVETLKGNSELDALSRAGNMGHIFFYKFVNNV